jgi:hypothetical protein
MSKRGSGMGARTPSASTRPTAWGSGSSVAGSTVTAAAIDAATSSTDASASPGTDVVPARVPKERVTIGQALPGSGGAVPWGCW